MVGCEWNTRVENVLSLGRTVNMETVLKPHNQIELPQEVCRKMALLPGMRFEIEIDSTQGTITLVPVTRELCLLHNQKRRLHLHRSTKSQK